MKINGKTLTPKETIIYLSKKVKELQKQAKICNYKHHDSIKVAMVA